MQTGLVAFDIDWDPKKAKDIPDFNERKTAWDNDDEPVWKGKELGPDELEGYPIEEEDKPIKEPTNMAVYCDAETLLENPLVDNRPNQKVVNALKTLHSSGNTVYLWSQAGWEYCADISEAFGLKEFVECYLDKPNILIDNLKHDDFIFSSVKAENVNDLWETPKEESHGKS